MAVECSEDSTDQSIRDSEWTLLCTVFPEEVTTTQSIPLALGTNPVGRLRLTFRSLGDFYGRMVVYSLSIKGYELLASEVESAAHAGDDTDAAGCVATIADRFEMILGSEMKMKTEGGGEQPKDGR